MKLQQLLSYTRRGIDDYQMIQTGDRIAIGISGGKDSLALLYALRSLQRFYPKKFQLEAISVDLGFNIQNFDLIKALCDDLEVQLTIIKTNIAQIVFEDRKETSPCSLCAKMRKGALNQKAKELQCNKVAYAHHKDDIVETMMLSLFYEGRIHTFAPNTYLDRMDLTVIRPFLYVNESDVISFTEKYQLPVAKNPCPVDGHTKRQYVKNILKQLQIENKEVRERMFTAILKSKISGWEGNVDGRKELS